MKKITIKDVAREAGVSVTLVSFVMNAKMGANGRLDCPVNPETAERVLAVAKRLGYRRNVAAASLRSGRSNTIAVITTDISNRFFAGISRYIEDKSVEYGYTVLFGSSDESVDKLDSVMDTVLAYNIDGVIIAPVPGGETAIRKAIDAKVPIVLLDRDIEGLDGVGKVLLDDVDAGRQATELLIGKGYTNIHMISYDLDISSISEREEGYKSTMSNRGLQSHVHNVPYGASYVIVKEIIQESLKSGAEAFFLPTYSLAASTLGALKSLNLHTPEDVAIVAFDESDIYRLGRTSIAHMVQPLKQLAEKSVELLHSMINQNAPASKIILKSEVVPGESIDKNYNK